MKMVFDFKVLQLLILEFDLARFMTTTAQFDFFDLTYRINFENKKKLCVFVAIAASERSDLPSIILCSLRMPISQCIPFFSTSLFGIVGGHLIFRTVPASWTSVLHTFYL
jgi:hypothetical protein